MELEGFGLEMLNNIGDLFPQMMDGLDVSGYCMGDDTELPDMGSVEPELGYVEYEENPVYEEEHLQQEEEEEAAGVYQDQYFQQEGLVYEEDPAGVYQVQEMQEPAAGSQQQQDPPLPTQNQQQVVQRPQRPRPPRQQNYQLGQPQPNQQFQSSTANQQYPRPVQQPQRPLGTPQYHRPPQQPVSPLQHQRPHATDPVQYLPPQQPAKPLKYQSPQQQPVKPLQYQSPQQRPQIPLPPAQQNGTLMTLGTWSTDLFACVDDVPLWCVALWFPCISFGEVAEIVDKGTTTCSTAGSIYTLLLCLTGCQFIYSGSTRTKIRRQYGIPGDDVEDFCTHLWCESCALVQEQNELTHRGYNVSLGWQGNMMIANQRKAQGVQLTPVEANRMTRY